MYSAEVELSTVLYYFLFRLLAEVAAWFGLLSYLQVRRCKNNLIETDIMGRVLNCN